MWRVTRRASCSAEATTAGADAALASPSAIVPWLTSRQWRRTWRKAKRPGTLSTETLWNQVRDYGCFLSYRCSITGGLTSFSSVPDMHLVEVLVLSIAGGGAHFFAPSVPCARYSDAR